MFDEKCVETNHPNRKLFYLCGDQNFPEQLFSKTSLGKIQVLLELLRVCEQRGEKLLVFSQSLLSLDLIEEFLAQCTALVEQNLPSPAGIGKWAKNVDYFRMDGATTGGKRHEVCTN